MNDITDHLPIFTFSLHEVKRNESKTFVYKRKNDEQSFKMFNNKLRQENLNSVINVDDVNIAYDSFIELFVIYYDEYCPIQKIYLNNKKVNHACKKKHLYISPINKTEENERMHKK